MVSLIRSVLLAICVLTVIKVDHVFAEEESFVNSSAKNDENGDKDKNKDTNTDEDEGSDGRIWFITGAPNLRKIRERIRDWDQSVLGFRKEHNFSYIVGPMSGQWRVKHFNNQVNQTYKDTGWLSKVRYSYHEQLYEGFGYYLGTSAGYWQTTGGSGSVKVDSATMLPGVVAGFSLNLTPGFRFVTGIEYYLERWNSLAEDDDEGEDSRVSITARALEWMIGFDVFFKLKWGVRFEGHRRRVEYVRPDDVAGKPVNILIERQDQAFAIGLVYHLM